MLIFLFFPDLNKNAGNILQTVLLEVLYVMEKDAERSALMQVEFPSFTLKVTAWMQPVKENIQLAKSSLQNPLYTDKYAWKIVGLNSN